MSKLTHLQKVGTALNLKDIATGAGAGALAGGGYHMLAGTSEEDKRKGKHPGLGRVAKGAIGGALAGGAARPLFDMLSKLFNAAGAGKASPALPGLGGGPLNQPGPVAAGNPSAGPVDFAKSPMDISSLLGSSNSPASSLVSPEDLNAPRSSFTDFDASKQMAAGNKALDAGLMLRKSLGGGIDWDQRADEIRRAADEASRTAEEGMRRAADEAAKAVEATRK
jgi:hypothetical protein